MATWNFNKKLYNAIVYRPILHLNSILKLTHSTTDCFLVVMLGILALLLVKDHQKTKDQLKSFDVRIINCTYTKQEHLLGIAVCSLIMVKDYP